MYNRYIVFFHAGSCLLDPTYNLYRKDLFQLLKSKLIELKAGTNAKILISDSCCSSTANMIKHHTWNWFPGIDVPVEQIETKGVISFVSTIMNESKTKDPSILFVVSDLNLKLIFDEFKINTPEKELGKDLEPEQFFLCDWIEGTEIIRTPVLPKG